MDDDDPIRAQPPPADRPQPPSAVDDGVLQRPPVQPLELPPRRHATGRGAGGCSPALVGAVALAMVLTMVLVIGIKLTRRTMWLTTERAIERVRQEALAAPLAVPERARLLAALAQFRQRLPLMSDPLPAIGTFLGRVQADLADDRLSRDEALALTELLEPLALDEVSR